MENKNPKLEWDKTGEHFYETGVSQGVLYPIDDTKTGTNKYGNGVEWNGLTSVSESPEGAEVSSLYADNIKYLNLISAEDFKGTIEAYTYPDKFAECDGSAAIADDLVGIAIGQQTRKLFGLSYSTKIGNDLTSEAGYKIHIVYNCLASPSERSYETVNDSPEAITFSWEFSTTPVNVKDRKPTAIVTIDSVKLNDKTKLALLESVLYGTTDSTTISTIAAKTYSDGTTPIIPNFDGNATLLLPDEIVALLA